MFCFSVAKLKRKFGATEVLNLAFLKLFRNKKETSSFSLFAFFFNAFYYHFNG